MLSCCSIAASWVAFAATPVAAADLGGDCCADLEKRVAKLEATAAQKGNRKVSLTVGGQVNKALLYWDDGFETNTYVVGNKNDQSQFSFSGEAAITSGWKAGYELRIRMDDNLSSEVSQDVANAGSDFFLWHSYWFVKSDKLGQVSLGLASRVSDTAPENDLSETSVAAFSGVQEIGAAFFLRLSNGTLSDVTWGNLYDHFNGETANIVRYDSPEISGFIFAVSWGEDDIWDIGLRYSGKSRGFKYEGAIAYTEVTDTTDELFGNPNGLDQSTVVGSVSVLHERTGLSLTLAAGNREWQGAAVDADGVARTPPDTKYIYTKLGWMTDLNRLGKTAFYGEYGRFKDYLTVTSTDVVTSLDPSAARITGNTADVWGVGVVQHIDAAEMQIYLGYRHHSADFDLVDGTGAPVGGPSLDDFDTVIAGSKIAF